MVFEPPQPSGRGPSSKPARIALILDDFGAGLSHVDRCLALPNEISFAVIPHLADSARVARDAHARGFDVFLHQPMEPHNYPKENPGRYGIYIGQSPEEVAAILTDNIASIGVPIVGVNNHMGSRATESKEIMTAFFDAFPRRLIFLDSRTSSQSVAYDIARAHGITALRNNIFLDAVQEKSAVETAFDQLVKMSKAKGFAVGIGHVQSLPTLEVLEARLPRLAEFGVSLVRLSDLARAPSNP